MRRMPVAVVAVLALAFAPSAFAGTLSVSGSTITYEAAPGEENFVTVNWGNSSAGPAFIPSLDDHAEITAVAPCEDDVALNARCPSAGPNPTYVVRLGDDDDFAQSINDQAAGHHVEFFGEDGDDTLQSDAGADLLDGGAGDDVLTPDDDDSGPADRVVGGPGKDTLQTGNPTGTSGPIGVSFDGVADDGYPGEADDYAADLEDLSATSVSVPIAFVGTDGPNVVQLRSEAADTVKGLGGDDRIDGANGNDVLDGGAGDDTIYGGGNDDTIIGGPGLDSLSGEGSASGLYISVAGNDRIDARDGVREQLNCGPGADTAIVDALDVVPQDPGSLCEAVERGAVARPVTVRSGSLRLRRGRIAVKLGCPAGGTTCRGRLRIRTAKAVKLGQRRRKVE
ncbi:MAG TPA: calcium-binding protein, partial [Solirubrobacterales bacterium]|nr:calcium-binding protein [Solirubrobacterales bacterium]